MLFLYFFYSFLISKRTQYQFFFYHYMDPLNQVKIKTTRKNRITEIIRLCNENIKLRRSW
jgi:hypothetical protein